MGASSSGQIAIYSTKGQWHPNLIAIATRRLTEMARQISGGEIRVVQIQARHTLYEGSLEIQYHIGEPEQTERPD